MFLEEYDQELHYKTLLEEGYEEGYEAYEQRINTLYQRLIADNRKEDFLHAFSDQEFRKKLFKEYGL